MKRLTAAAIIQPPAGWSARLTSSFRGGIINPDELHMTHRSLACGYCCRLRGKGDFSEVWTGVKLPHPEERRLVEQYAQETLTRELRYRQ